MTLFTPKPLGELVDIFDHVRVPLSGAQRSTRSGPYPYYGAQGVIDHIDDYLFDGRYLLIPEDGENLNSRKLPIAYFADGRFWVNNHAHIVRAKPFIADDVFLKHAINSLDIRAYVTGAAQPKLSQANLRRITIPAPALDVQQRIGSILGAYDELIEVNRRRIALLEDQARSLFLEWIVHLRFPGREDEIRDASGDELPAAWQRAELKDLCALMKSGSTPSRGRKECWDQGTVDWYTTGELWDEFLIGSKEKVTNQAVQSGAARTFPADTILMAIYGSPTVGRLGITTHDCSANQAALAMRPNPERIKLWVLYYSLFFRRDHFNSISQGAAQQNISKEKVAGTTIVVPPADLQQKYQELVDPMKRLQCNLQLQNSRLKAERELLLPRLISGQLRLSPAAQALGTDEILESIAAE